MIVSDHAPMIAAVTNGSTASADSWDRQDRKQGWHGRGWKRGETKSTRLEGLHKDRERRALKRAERIEVRELVAEFIFTSVEVIDFEDDVEQTYALEALYAEDTPSCGCGCRRCVLHDDHGGCTEPWNHIRPTGVFHARADHVNGGFYA